MGSRRQVSTGDTSRAIGALGESVPRLVARRPERLVGCCARSPAIRGAVVLLRLAHKTASTREVAVLFVGVDWAERHHDVCPVDEQGAVLAKRRITDGLVAVTDLITARMGMS